MTTDAMIRDALWNTIKKGWNEGSIIGSVQGLGASLQEDKKWSDNAKDFIIGYLVGGGTGSALAGSGALLRIAVNKTKYIQNELFKELVAKGFSPEQAKGLVSEGGYIGDLLSGKSTNLEPGKTGQEPLVPQGSGTATEQTGQGSLSSQASSIMGKTDVVSSGSYEGGIPQPGSYVKERGFMTSLKNDSETAAIFKDVVDNYMPHVNKEDIATIRAMQIMEPEKYLQLVRSSDPGAQSTIAKVMQLRDAIKAGNVAEYKAMAKVLAPRGTELGQGIQAFRTLGADMGDPARALVTAEKDIQSANKNIAPKFEGKAKFVEKQFQKAHEEVADQIIKENPVFQAKPKAVTPLEKGIEKQVVPAEEQLASRITVLAKAKKPNPVKDMLDTLLKVANETLPKKAIKPRKML